MTPSTFVTQLRECMKDSHQDDTFEHRRRLFHECFKRYASQPDTPLYFSPEDTAKMASILHIDVPLFQQWITDSRYKQRKTFGTLSREQKNKLDKLIPQFESGDANTRAQLEKLSQEFNVGVKKIQSYLFHREKRAGRLSRLVRIELQQWAREHPYPSLSDSDLQNLEQKFGIPATRIRFYLYQLHYRRTHRPGIVASRKKHVAHVSSLTITRDTSMSMHHTTPLREWMANHGIHELSDETLQSLAHKSNLDPKSVLSYMHKYKYDTQQRSGRLTNEQLRLLREWITQQKDNVPTQYAEIARKTGLPESRIKAYAKQYTSRKRNRSGALTRKQKDELQQWYQSSKQPVTLEQLANSLHLPSGRVKEYLYRYQKYGERKAQAEQNE